MNQLLAIEWLKIKRYRTFWVLAALFVVLLPLWNYGITNGFMKLGGGGKNGVNLVEAGYTYPAIWANLGFWGSIFIVFTSILVIILTTNEYNFRTNRQNVIDGWTRMKFFHSKVLLVLSLSVAVTVFLFILGLLFGAIGGGSVSNIMTGIEQVGYFFLLSLDYMGFALFISVWIRRSGLAIGLFMLYSMIIENILKASINHFVDTPFGNLLPLQASDELLPFPLVAMAKKMMAMGTTISMPTYALVAMGWCVLYYFAGRTILMRNDW